MCQAKIISDNSSESIQDNVNYSSEPELQFVDNDVNIPPITDTGPIDPLINISVNNNNNVIVSEDIETNLSAQDILKSEVQEDLPSVIAIGFNEAVSQNSGLSDG